MLRSHLLPLFHLLQDPGLEDTADIKRVSSHHKQLWKQCQRHSVLCCLGNSKSHRRGKLVYHTYLSHCLSILYLLTVLSPHLNLSHTHTPSPPRPRTQLGKIAKQVRGKESSPNLKKMKKKDYNFFLKKNQC